MALSSPGGVRSNASFPYRATKKSRTAAIAHMAAAGTTRQAR